MNLIILSGENAPPAVHADTNGMALDTDDWANLTRPDRPVIGRPFVPSTHIPALVAPDVTGSRLRIQCGLEVDAKLLHSNGPGRGV